MNPKFIQSHMWHRGLKTPVIVESQGHFEIGTVICTLPTGIRIETYINDLEDFDDALERGYSSEVNE